VKNETQKLDCLEMRIEEYDPFMDRAQEAAYLEHYSHSLSWSENKRKLQAMANEVLDRDSANLLQKICLSDGSNANTKSDILSAWEDWKKQMTNHNK
jgi:cell shape-determining protein MreC